MVDSAALTAPGSRSCSRRAPPACTRITLIACAAESCRSRAIRLRSSATASRRSRAVSRSDRSCALTQVSQPLSALAQLVPDDPRPTPHDDRAEDRDRGKPRRGRRGDTNVDCSQRHHSRCDLPHPLGCAAVEGEVEQGDRRSEWGAEGVAEALDRRARDSAHDKHFQGPAAVRQQRQTGDRRQPDAQRVEGSGRPGSVRQHGEREAERGRRDHGVARHSTRCVGRSWPRGGSADTHIGEWIGPVGSPSESSCSRRA